MQLSPTLGPDLAPNWHRFAGRSDAFHLLFDELADGYCVIEFLDGPEGPCSDYIHVAANPAYAANAGIEQVVGQRLRAMVPAEADAWVARYGHVLATGERIHFEQELVATGRLLELTAFRIGEAEDRLVAVLFKDATARSQAEAARDQARADLEHRFTEALAERTQRLAEAEEQLRQSQKMEAVGQLTGGLAHDFNNLLGGISGALEMIGQRLAAGRAHDVKRYLDAAQAAAARAASLTHRLLAFSRRQTLTPTSTDLHALVEGLADLIRHSIGPQIALETRCEAGLWPVRVDTSQLENAVLNLSLNSRDAMPDGGRIVIACKNFAVSAEEALEYEVAAGDYVELCVHDTGTGIDGATLGRVFEPFFTTKPIGAGTGLGLSMVYGFARQSGGFVRISSPPGEGTTVQVVLPRVDAGRDDAEAPTTSAAVGIGNGAGGDGSDGGGETIVVIDDEALIRMTVIDDLADHGYTCFDAGDGKAGLALLEAHPETALLVTDVGLPGGLNGRQVADAARVTRPDLKVLFITGYAEQAALSEEHIGAGMAVLVKPFTMGQLISEVARLLGRTAP